MEIVPARASVIVPTRDRASYLDVALASIRPQAAAEGVEVVVVDDGPDPATRATAARHGARYVAHPSSRGLNAARNTGIAATTADLLVFVDDDVAVRPGWLAALLAAHATAPPEVAVFAGPIHARIEDHRYPTCGREGAPITELDLGPHDGPADHAWGANMTVRRSALDAVGRFDERLELYGDEQELQRRLPAAGLTIRYVAAAALDHRRAGNDARLRSLMAAAYRRGGASRRFDVLKGTAPSLPAELRTLAGCAVHGPRRRCFNGPVMAAHSAGRLRAALTPEGRRTPATAAEGDLRGPTNADPDDFTSGQSGTVGGRRGTLRRHADRVLDARLAADPRLRRARATAAALPAQRVHVVGVERPGRAMAAVRTELLRSHHDVTMSTAPPGSLGKFQNLNALLGGRAPDADWLLVVDDDIVLPSGFLDLFVGLATSTGLRLAQPAHRLHSHAAWPVTRRATDARSPLVRQTTFVEIGPVTLLHRDTFGVLVPFPDLRMGWGLDNAWSATAQAHGWPLGVVDATPILHLSPAASGYARTPALEEARTYLRGRPYVRRDEVLTLRRLA